MASLADEDIRDAVDALIDLLGPWDPLDALTWLRMSNLPWGEEYQESTHDGLLAVVEIAGLALLSREPRPADGSHLVDRAVGDSALDPPGEIADLCRRASALVREVLGAALVGELARAQSEGPSAYVRFRMREREVLLRNIEYPHIHTELVREQLGQDDIRRLMRDAVGFEVDDALAVVDAFQERFTSVLDSRITRARAEVGALLESDAPHLAAARARLGSRLHSAAQAFAAAYVGDRLGQRIAATGAELAAAAGTSEDRVAAVIAAFSQPFLGASHDPVNAVKTFLGGHNPWRLKPVLAIGDGRYLCIDVGLMLSAIREVVEASLPASDRPEYAKATARWMENVAVDDLSRVLQPDAVHRNVEYIASTGAAVELDALLVCDTVAIAVEAKGTTLSARSRTGDRARMARDLERIVTKTFEQADRVRATIQAHGELRVRGRDAPPIALQGVSKVLPVALTLEDVSTISGTIHDLLESGLVRFDGTPPWLISQHDLHVITEIVEGPAQMLAYLDQHEKAVTAGVLGVSEELDLFMMFLQDGLWLGDSLDEDGQPTERLFVTSRTDDLDAYYLHTVGDRVSPAPKPAQRWNPGEMRQLLERLQTARPPGWATAVINLQRGDANVRRGIGGAPKRLAKQARRDGAVHDETRCFEDPHHESFGVTVLAAPATWNDTSIEDRLRTLVTARKHIQRASSWTGLAVRGDAPDTVRFLVQLDHAWQPDPALDELVVAIGMRPAAEVGIAPVRG
ncbi:hypothetical protein [Cellulomonas algicola]|uniref:hypothetical protein n=1 Tax=Cellulomonas algicola TaxID=2071633 RepID=UPI000F572EF3|nr:hypothetical protein [Cellulomonas algicola]